MIPDLLQKQLHSPLRAVRREAAAALRAQSSLERLTIPVWVEHLSDPDWWLRLNAGAALVDLSLSHTHRLVEAVPALLAALGDEHTGVRRYAVTALGRSKAPHAAAIAALLSDEDPEVREKACFALSCVGTPAAARALVGVLDQDDKLAELALRALRIMGAAAHPAVEPLIAQALSGASLPRRALAASALHAIPGARDVALKLLEAALEDPQTRRAAARALARLATAADLDRISALLTDPALRPQVLAGLHEPHEVIWPAVASCLDDPDPGVRRRAASLLVPATSQGRFIDTFRRLLRDPDAQLQASAIRALGAIGDLPSLPVLRSLLAAGEQVEAVLEALGGYHAHPEQVLPVLLEETRSEARLCSALRSIVCLGEGARPARRRLLALAADDSDEVRHHALRALGWVPDDQGVIDALCQALLAGDGMACVAAAESLGRLGPAAGAAAGAALVRFIAAHRETVVGGGYVSGWEAALLSVGHLAAPDAVPLLSELLSGPLSIYDEAAVIRALGRLGGAEALARVVAEDPPVQAALSVACARLGDPISTEARREALQQLARELDLQLTVLDDPGELRLQALLEDIAALAEGGDPELAGMLRPVEADPKFVLLSPWISAALRRCDGL